MTETLRLFLESVDRAMLQLVRARLNPQIDAETRFRAIQLEKSGVCAKISPRCDRVVENLVLTLTMVVRDLPISVRPVMLRCAFAGAYFTAQAYEAASAPGVLHSLAHIEACFGEDEQGFVILNDEQLREAATELVTALRMQDEKEKTDEDGR